MKVLTFSHIYAAKFADGNLAVFFQIICPAFAESYAYQIEQAISFEFQKTGEKKWAYFAE
jgi:hypothetical protein